MRLVGLSDPEVSGKGGVGCWPVKDDPSRGGMIDKAVKPAILSLRGREFSGKLADLQKASLRGPLPASDWES